MEGGLVQGCGLSFGNTHEDWIVDPTLQEKGGEEASHGDVASVWLTHKVEAPWDEETNKAMTYQFGGGFQELAEV